MKKTRYDLIKNAGEDRDAMINALEKHDKVMRKGYFMMGIGILSSLVGFISLELNFAPGVWGLVIAPIFLIFAAIIPLRGSGLI